MRLDIKELEIADYNLLENLKAAFYRLWKLKSAVFVLTLIGLLTSFVFIGFIGVKTNYVATTSIFSAAYGSLSDSSGGVSFMNTYSSLLNSTRVCDKAAAQLNDSSYSSDALKEMVEEEKIYIKGASTNSKNYQYKIYLVAVEDNPSDAIKIANAMADAFVTEINDLAGGGTLQVMDVASDCEETKNINEIIVAIIFSGLTFILSTFLIFVKEFFSEKVYLVSQCEQDEDLILGLIPNGKSKEIV
jgi:capsular polysaccharide biosynthesis protein